MIKGLKVNSKTGEEEVKNLMRYRSKVRVAWVKRVGRMKEGKEGIFLVILGCEEDRLKIMVKQKLLKGRTERIKEDLTCQKRRRKWLIEQRAWAERRKGGRVKIGRDRIWVNGEMWIRDEEIEELRVWQTRQGRENEKEQGNRKRRNASGFMK